MHSRARGLGRLLGWIVLCNLCNLSSLAAGSAHAALTAEQSRCQKGAAKEAERFLKRTLSALFDCHDRIGRGSLPAGTDCRVEATTSAKLGGVAARLAQRVPARCTDAAVASLDFGEGCVAVMTSADLATCLRATHDVRADDLVSVLYGTTGELSAGARRCQGRVASLTGRFATSRMRLLQKCKNRAAQERVPVGTVCTDDAETAAKIERRRSGLEPKVESRCDPSALAALPFGSPCASPDDAADLSGCALGVAEAAGDRALRTEYGVPAPFCGDSTQGIDARIEEILEQMTLEEKVEQMHGLQLAPINGLYHTPSNEALGIPGLRMVDGPRGVRAGNATAFPVGMARGASWDPDLEERVGEAIGTEARAKGASVILAPTMNVLRHPRWGRSQETYGEDPLHMGLMASGFVRGAQRHVIASAKHFALNSIEDTRFVVNVSADERTLREIYLPHFKRAVEEAGVASVMSAYNLVNGFYCAENFHLLREILKGEWGFKGFVESDWFFGVRSTAPSAIAGLDIEMPFPQYYGPPLVTAVQMAQVPEATIDDAVRAILRVQFCFALDSDPPQVDPALVESPEHTSLAREAAAEGAVLLKNSSGALPLDRNALTSIAVVGTLADEANLGDNGSSNVTPSYAVTPLDGITSAAGAVAVTFIEGEPLTVADETVISAADAAIVVTGLTRLDEGEGFIGAGDRSMLPLESAQEQLIQDVAALNARTIVVLEGGGAIVVENWVDDVEAILMAWYPGLEGGNAIADLLFGDANPSGRLPLTFPRDEADLPAFINDQTEVTYDYYHGYRYVDRESIDPRFEFGFGLSYTTFSYANLVLADTTLTPDGTLEASVDVTNTGARAGEEVVQLYVSTVGSAVDRPVRDLRAFSKVALAPAETKTVSLSVPVEDLAYYDVGTGEWQIETISYVAHVGASSRDLPESASFQVVTP